jgi:hypothetical protein
VPRPRRPERGRKDELDRLFASLPDWVRKGLASGLIGFLPGSKIPARDRGYGHRPPGTIGQAEYLAWVKGGEN